jgi:hypothetical protein
VGENQKEHIILSPSCSMPTQAFVFTTEAFLVTVFTTESISKDISDLSFLIGIQVKITHTESEGLSIKELLQD